MAKILAIDDNLELLKMLEVILQAHRHLVQIAQTKSEAISKLNTFKPDVILLDAELQPNDGRELSRIIRSLTTWNPVILLMTTSPEHHKYHRNEEADDVIDKPFDTNTIPYRIDRLMDYRLRRKIT